MTASRRLTISKKSQAILKFRQFYFSNLSINLKSFQKKKLKNLAQHRCHDRKLINHDLVFLRNIKISLESPTCKGRLFKSPKDDHFFLFFGHTTRLEDFSSQGSSPCHLQWKHRVLTTGLPGKSPKTITFNGPTRKSSRSPNSPILCPV